MYDMTGFDYDITDVANLLRLHKRRGNYYDCPFCGDTKGRLNINPAKNVFRCNRCDKSGGMLQLYADLHNLTYREANEEIWSYVKKKYKLNMPFLRLAYPARASAFSSNAA